MSIQQQINEDLKNAMRARDDVAKLALRAVKTALTEAVKSGDGNADSDGLLDDAAVQEIVQRQAKRRREAAAEYEKADQPERAAQELAELMVLEVYLPQQLSEEEITTIVRAALAETGASSMKEMGKVMSAAMPKIAGRADGKVVNQIVRTLLSA